MEFLILGHALDAGLLGKLCRWFENAVLDKVGFDVLGHGSARGRGNVGRKLSTRFFFIRKIGKEKEFPLTCHTSTVEISNRKRSS
jgi:hypothetical protein